MHIEYRPGLPTLKETTPEIPADAARHGRKAFGTVFIKKMLHAGHLINDQRRRNAAVLDHEGADPSAMRPRPAGQETVQVKYRKKRATDVGNTCHPGLRTWDAQKGGADNYFSYLPQGGDETEVADAEANAVPCVLGRGLLRQTKGVATTAALEFVENEYRFLGLHRDLAQLSALLIFSMSSLSATGLVT